MNIEEILKDFRYRERMSYKTLYKNSKGDEISIYNPGCGIIYFTSKVYHPRYQEYVLHGRNCPSVIYFNGDIEWHFMGQKFESEEDYWIYRLREHWKIKRKVK